MNIFATCLIILLSLSYGFARGIPDSFSESRRRFLQFPSSDEVWREPFFGKSPFLNTDNDYVDTADASPLLPKPSEESDSQESHESDPRGKIGENDVPNSNADSEEEHDDDLKQINSDTDDNDSNESKDEENSKIDDEEDQEAQDDEDDDIPDKGKKEHVPPSFDGSLSLHNPFFNLKQMTTYLKELERALEQVFRQTMEEAALLNGTYANTTEEKMDIDGQKFIVQKSVIKTGDNNSSIFIEAIDVLPEQGTNRTKRSNWYAEKAQKAKESDP